MVKKAFHILALLLIAQVLYAYDVKVGDLYYNLNGTEATVVVGTDTPWEQASYITTSITIPSSIQYEGQTYTVTAIGKSAFAYCGNLTAITLPNTLQEVDSFAFHLCANLQRIELPESTQHIRAFAFYQCTNLSEVSLPSTLQTIGQDAFSACLSLTDIRIPKSTTQIDAPILSLCSALQSIVVETGNTVYRSQDHCLIHTATKTLVAGCSQSTIPTDGTVTTIGTFAFAGCDSLTAIVIPTTITTLSPYAFALNPHLSAMDIPASVTHIGASAFTGCESLTNISIPQGTTHIGAGAFALCSGLARISLPASVSEIGYGILANCPHLSSITVDANNPVYHTTSNALIRTASYELLAGCSTTTLPTDGSVKAIAQDAFAGCYKLLEITIPNAITSIGDYAFSGCERLTKAELGTGINHIGIRAFADCEALHSLLLTSITPPTAATNILAGANTDCDISVPCGAVDAYMHHTVWGKLNNLMGRTEYTLVAESESSDKGTVYVAQEPTCDNGYTAFLVAFALGNNVFEQWSDGNKENPRTLILTENTNLTASFIDSSSTDLTDVEASINRVQKVLENGHLYIIFTDLTTGEINKYSVDGRRLL